MKNNLILVSLLVRDYDEAIRYYTDVLGFRLTEDKAMEEGKRWVVVHPPGSDACGLLLARAKGDKQVGAIGQQTGGRVGFFLHTDSFSVMHERLLQHNVAIVRGPVDEEYGKVLVFADLYGNLWDLIQPCK
jgi:catechol 2,3-dioxygenase-like lactoylglutathione lyase family enzyme